MLPYSRQKKLQMPPFAALGTETALPAGLTMLTSVPPRAAEGGVAPQEAVQEGRRKAPRGRGCAQAPGGASGEGGLTHPLASSPGTILDSGPPELKDTLVRLEATEFVASGCHSHGDRDQEPPPPKAHRQGPQPRRAIKQL